GSVFEFLRQVPFLQRLPGSSLRKLAEVVQVKQYGGLVSRLFELFQLAKLSEYVVHEGEIGDGIYFILEGQVEISGSASTEEGNHSDLLLKQYDYFGYESGGSIHQANVVALSKLTCLVLPNSYRSLLQPKSIWYADESPGGLSLMEHILCLEPLEVSVSYLSSLFEGLTTVTTPLTPLSERGKQDHLIGNR
ncbi:acyl-coenzyme A thioesterase 8-like, partial [Musa troglodytarum]